MQRLPACLLMGTSAPSPHQIQSTPSSLPYPWHMSTSCLLPHQGTLHNHPLANAASSQTGLSGIPHLGDKDFTPLIERALALPGFLEGSLPKRPVEDGRLDTVTVGFGHHVRALGAALRPRRGRARGDGRGGG
jgi:hypothetical protein